MTYTEADFEAARQECIASRAAARQREFARPIQASIDELIGDRQRRRNVRADEARAMWGAPEPGSSFARGTMGLPGRRNTTFRP
jgi:hypothetical protein